MQNLGLEPSEETYDGLLKAAVYCKGLAAGMEVVISTIFVFCPVCSYTLRGKCLYFYFASNGLIFLSVENDAKEKFETT